MIYSANGTYDSYKVQLNNANLKTHKCGGTFNNDGTITRKFQIANRAVGGNPPAQIACTPVGGGASYTVFFGANRNFTAAKSVTVDADANYCTIVHVDSTAIRKVALGAKNTCYGTDLDKDSSITSDVSVKVLPAVGKDKKSIVGYVNVTADHEILRTLCTGQLTVEYLSLQGTEKQTVALKYVRAPKNGFSYCVAVLKKAPAAAGDYTVTATEAGTPYFNPASGSANITVPII